MEHVMVDLETLGRRAGCSILSIGAVAFDFKTEQLGEKFYVVVNRQSCAKAGLHEDELTLAWWSDQTDAAKKVLAEAETGKSLREALSSFAVFIGNYGLKKVKIWGNGSDFDNAILTACYAAIGQDTPWEFWNNRCYRTLRSLRPELRSTRNGTYHNALDDAVTQAVHALEIYSAFNGRT